MQDMFVQVRAICDPLIAAGATPSDLRPITRRYLGLEIGEGGGGPRTDVPPCGYCGAHGGGGHGGWCPGPLTGALGVPEGWAGITAESGETFYVQPGVRYTVIGGHSLRTAPRRDREGHFIYWDNTRSETVKYPHADNSVLCHCPRNAAHVIGEFFD